MANAVLEYHFLLGLTIFITFLMLTVDKFLNFGHLAGIFDDFLICGFKFIIFQIAIYACRLYCIILMRKKDTLFSLLKI